MERPPSINYEKVEQEKREVSPEKRSKMWETLRIAALTGVLAFGGVKAVEQMTEGTAERDQSKITESIKGDKAAEGQITEETEEAFKRDFGREMTEKEREYLMTWRQETMGLSLEERASMTISVVEDKGMRVEDGRIIQETAIQTKDGKTYEVRAETDADSSPLVDPATGNLKVGRLAGEAGNESWNRSFISRTEQDGSGLKVSYEATKDGLEMTIQELGPGGQVLSQRTSLTQEKIGS